MACIVEKPADMGVVEAAHQRAVGIAFAIGVLVMIDVMACPPERAFLHRRRAEKRPQEPHAAVHLKRAMCQIAMEDERQADRAEKM